MCQVQWSGELLPSEAAMPPCAATVWLRVGNTLVMHAVFSPASALHIVARRPDPPAPTPTVRSAERRVGKECVSECRSRGSPSLAKKQTATYTKAKPNIEN